VCVVREPARCIARGVLEQDCRRALVDHQNVAVGARRNSHRAVDLGAHVDHAGSDVERRGAGAPDVEPLDECKGSPGAGRSAGIDGVACRRDNPLEQVDGTGPILLGERHVRQFQAGSGGPVGARLELDDVDVFRASEVPVASAPQEISEAHARSGAPDQLRVGRSREGVNDLEIGRPSVGQLAGLQQALGGGEDRLSAGLRRGGEQGNHECGDRQRNQSRPQLSRHTRTAAVMLSRPSRLQAVFTRVSEDSAATVPSRTIWATSSWVKPWDRPSDAST